MSAIHPASSETASIAALFAQQQAYAPIAGRSTVKARKAKLRRLHDCLLRRRQALYQAMAADFNKGEAEVNISEIGVINTEIRHTIRHLSSWLTPKNVGTPIMLIGTRSEIRYESKGVCLILSPWNFPFNLTFVPLISAIAGGNCVILKPSEYTPHCSALIKSIVEECFSPEEVCVVEGDASVARALTDLPFNHIFFTGSPEVGKIVMAAAARHLSSVTLELGGKSPVVVDETADLDVAAAKIAWLKAMNAGQCCIACDYVLVQESVQDKLLEKIAEKLRRFYGETPEARKTTPDYCRIVNDRHFERVKKLLDDAVQRGGRIAFGGVLDPAERYFEPTVLTGVPEDATIWSEEIFGPPMLVRSYRALDEAIAWINARPRPLTMYIFSARRRNIETLLSETRAGCGSVNDTGINFYHNDLPFGGINTSGIGKCHGHAGFLEFVNQRGITYQNRIFPHTNLFQPPYTSRLANTILQGVLRWF
ncbi:MAG TPA: aldehyde dehydrogenase family protein [Saprospiraceae bacterium]|nr:aldehyde dehydrogenase family protein [Saprospiraceae bacterium]